MHQSQVRHPLFSLDTLLAHVVHLFKSTSFSFFISYLRLGRVDPKLDDFRDKLTAVSTSLGYNVVAVASQLGYSAQHVADWLSSKHSSSPLADAVKEWLRVAETKQPLFPLAEYSQSGSFRPGAWPPLSAQLNRTHLLLSIQLNSLQLPCPPLPPPPRLHAPL